MGVVAGGRFTVALVLEVAKQVRQLDGIPAGELPRAGPVGETVQDVAVRLLGMLGLAPLVAEVLPKLLYQRLHLPAADATGVLALRSTGTAVSFGPG